MAKIRPAKGIVAQGELFSRPLEPKDIRDLIPVMEFPMFGLSRRPDMVVREFGSLDKTFVRVSPGARGLATMWDHDVLIFCVSKINAEANEGLAPRHSVTFKAHEMLTACGRGTNKRAYEQLKDALFRLQSTTIETNIKADGRTEARGFSWINDFRILDEADDVSDPKAAKAMRSAGGLRMTGIEVTLARWIVDLVSTDRRVLTIAPEYFYLESGLERRLYQIARKHCGDQVSWTFSLGRLAEKVGTVQELRRFKTDLIEAIERDNIPGYAYRIVEPVAEVVTGKGRRRRARMDQIQVVIEKRTGPHVGERVLRKAMAEAEGSPDCSADGSFTVAEWAPAGSENWQPVQ